MGSRYLSVALISALIVLLAGTGVGQTVPRNDARQLRHVMAVRAERTERLLDSWEGAEPSDRARVLDFLETAGEGAPLGRRPSVQALELARRMLIGEVGPGGPTPLEAFAVSLDLQAIPGSFPPAPDGSGGAKEEPRSQLGAPITVGMYALPGAPSLAVSKVDVTLFWERVGEEGPTRIRARTEPFAPASFVNPGVPLYVRAPRSAAGLWTLVPELNVGSERVRGVGVPVWCEDPATKDGGAWSPDLFEFGLRAPRAVDTTWLDDLPCDAPVVALGAPQLPSVSPELHVLLLAPAGEAAATPFVGRCGELWTAFAMEHAARVWACEIGSNEKDAFTGVLAAARAASPGAEVVVIARGDAALVLHSFLLGATTRPDRIVLACDLERAGGALGSIETLLISPFTLEGSADPTWLTRVKGERESLFEERRLPGRLTAWLGD